MEASATSMIVTYLFIGATIVQLFFWLSPFRRLAEFQPQTVERGEIEEKPVSVIISAHNEEENLKKNLYRFLNQTYRSFEIIVINDNSSDKTLEVLLNIKSKHPILRIVDVNVFTPPGKKASLTKGIEAARFDTILLTDADCHPNSSDWIFLMQAAIKDETQIGLGFSPYTSEKGFLNIFIRFETVYSAIQFFSFALVGFPYMGVGRNLIYKKSLFLSAGGFDNHLHIASGDDDLFINEVATSKNTSIILNPGAFVSSTPKRTWKGYYHQKSRHLTTSTEYKLVHQLLLGALAASHLLHYSCAVVLIWFGEIEITAEITFSPTTAD